MSTTVPASSDLSLSTRWYAGDPNPFLGRLLDFRNPIPPHPLSFPRPFQLWVDQRCLIYSPSIPSSLIDFLANPAHTFVGVGIHKDMDGGLHYGLTVANAVDLRVPAAEAYGARELRNAGLAVLARQVLGAGVVKPRRVTMIIPGFLNGPCVLYQCSAFEVDTNETAWLFVNASEAFGQTISETLFGIFFEV